MLAKAPGVIAQRCRSAHLSSGGACTTSDACFDAGDAGDAVDTGEAGDAGDLVPLTGLCKHVGLRLVSVRSAMLEETLLAITFSRSAGH